MLISIEEAQAAILARCEQLPTEAVTLWQALGRRLSAAIIAPHDVPPFRNAAMDGYAVVAQDVVGACVDRPIVLTVVGEVAAGGVPTGTPQAGQAVRIMTGAPVPDGADAVVRFEESSEGWALERRPPAHQVAICHAAQVGENVRLAGEDMMAGATVLTPGMRLRPAHIGILATLGVTAVPVTRRPRVAILATGDELVPPESPLAPGQIRNANEYTMAALVQEAGGIPIPLGIARDNTASIAAKLEVGLAQGVDLFLTSAGVSVGDYDKVKEALAAQGQMAFWQVAIKPGKPLAFGLLHSVGQPVPLLGLPGNPVAAMVAFHVFAQPAIRKMGDTPLLPPPYYALLTEAVANSGRRHYLRARAGRDQSGTLWVTTRTDAGRVQGSGILSAMIGANCYAVVPEGSHTLPKGSRVAIEMFHWQEEEF